MCPTNELIKVRCMRGFNFWLELKIQIFLHQTDKAFKYRQCSSIEAPLHETLKVLSLSILSIIAGNFAEFMSP